MDRPVERDRVSNTQDSKRGLARAVCMALVAGALACAATCARADVDPWTAGSNWLYLRAGYAKSGAEGAGDGGGGFGFGFRHMLSSSRVNDWTVFGVHPLPFVHWSLFKHWSFGGFAEYDVISSYGAAKEIEIPVALDMTRHIMLKGEVKPYFSLGFGPFYRKTYGTSADFGRVAVSGYVAGGFDARVAPGQLLGIDARLARVDSENTPPNPVFGPGQNEASHWSVKLVYSLAY
jgi:hypothetical protein